MTAKVVSILRKPFMKAVKTRKDAVTCIDCAERMNMDEKEMAILFNLKTKRAEPSVRK